MTVAVHALLRLVMGPLCTYNNFSFCRYQQLTEEVLTQVMSMEQSLSRISKAKKTEGLSDDDKIRLQLHFDVLAFGRETVALGVEHANNVSYQQLLSAVEQVKPTLLEERPSLVATE